MRFSKGPRTAAAQENSDWSSNSFAEKTQSCNIRRFVRRYTRNLVDEGNGRFNLMVLCWGEGHGSAIHDHANAHCVMKILQGKLCEVITATIIIGTAYFRPRVSYVCRDVKSSYQSNLFLRRGTRGPRGLFLRRKRTWRSSRNSRGTRLIWTRFVISMVWFFFYQAVDDRFHIFNMSWTVFPIICIKLFRWRSGFTLY